MWEEWERVLTSMVLMCLSRDSKDESEPTASSSFSFSLIHKEKASDSLLKCSHHIHTCSISTMLQEHSAHCVKHIICIPRSTL